MLSFALKTLASDRGKFFTGVAGVVFALVLMNIQGGLYLGLMSKASLLVDHCDADLWVGQKRVDNVDLARDIPEIWMNRIRALPDIDRVEAYIVGKGTATLKGGRLEDVWIVGSHPRSMLGTAWGFISGSPESLKRPDAVSFDEVDLKKLENPRVGEWLEVNGHRARLVAQTKGITGFITMPYLFTTLETARRLSDMRPGFCSFFLVRAVPGCDKERLAAQVRRRLPNAAVFTPPEFARISQDYWMERTGIGISFGASTCLGLLVGLMMVGQSLYALALDHLAEFATLKAMGADDSQVCRVILIQSLTMAGIGALVGVLIVLAVGKLWYSPLAPLEIRPSLLLGSTLVIAVIGLAASLLPYLRIRRIDPAVVLQG
ncbi:MAG: FtsX-like permease family protein [Planctomycetes bacterium]|nr:FtsX-like permease family protein [Planctomycetota bacterium]